MNPENFKRLTPVAKPDFQPTNPNPPQKNDPRNPAEIALCLDPLCQEYCAKIRTCQIGNFWDIARLVDVMNTAKAEPHYNHDRFIRSLKSIDLQLAKQLPEHLENYTKYPTFRVRVEGL